MAKRQAAMQSWNIFHFARKHLGRSALYSMFGKKNARRIDYWCEDPKYTTKPEFAYDPIMGVRNLLETLDDHGHCGVVRACIAYLSAGTSACCGFEAAVVEPLPTVAEEILADYQAVADLQRAIEDDADMEEIDLLKREALDEIERTVAKCRELRR